MSGKIEVFRDDAELWRWRIVDSDGVIVAMAVESFSRTWVAHRAAVREMASDPGLPPLPGTLPGPTPQGDP
jgi:hypothetical protein